MRWPEWLGSEASRALEVAVALGGGLRGPMEEEDKDGPWLVLLKEWGDW